VKRLNCVVAAAFFTVTVTGAIVAKIVAEVIAEIVTKVAADIVAEAISEIVTKVAADIVAEAISDIVAKVADIIAEIVTVHWVDFVLFVELVLVDIFAVFDFMLVGQLFFLANVVALEVVAYCSVFLTYEVAIRTSFFLFNVVIYVIAHITVARLIVGRFVVADNVAIFALVTLFGFLVIAIIKLDVVVVGAAHLRDRAVKI